MPEGTFDQNKGWEKHVYYLDEGPQRREKGGVKNGSDRLLGLPQLKRGRRQNPVEVRKRG